MNQTSVNASRFWLLSGLVILASASVAPAQSSPTGVGVGSGSGSSSGPGTAPPTSPYRDPWLDPSYTTEYTEPAEIESWIGPPEFWQIGVPVWYGGYRAYVVRDAESYVGQFDEEYAKNLWAYPASVSGLLVDLVFDTRLPVSGVRRYTFNNYSSYGGIRLGNYEFRRNRPRGGYPGAITGRWGAWGLMPWYWYWLDWTPLELDRLEPIRASYTGPIDGHLVPGLVPVELAPEPDPVPSDREIGVEALLTGDYPVAVLRLLEHLGTDEGRGDWTGRRLLALALLADRRAEDAASLLRLTYLGDPDLAHEPVDAAVLDSLPLRVMGSLAGQHAKFANSASGWFQLAVMLRLQGLGPRALEMLDRAEGWGLEPEILIEMRVALTP